MCKQVCRVRRQRAGQGPAIIARESGPDIRPLLPLDHDDGQFMGISSAKPAATKVHRQRKGIGRWMTLYDGVLHILQAFLFHILPLFRTHFLRRLGPTFALTESCLQSYIIGKL